MWVCVGQVLADILSGAAIADPALLSPFLLLTFADLKSQKYVYWFAHPVLAPKALYNLAGAPAQLSPDATAQLIQTLRRLGETSGGRIPPFFCVDPVTYAASPLSPSGSLFGFVDPCPLENNPGWPLR